MARVARCLFGLSTLVTSCPFVALWLHCRESAKKRVSFAARDASKTRVFRGSRRLEDSGSRGNDAGVRTGSSAGVGGRLAEMLLQMLCPAN